MTDSDASSYLPPACISNWSAYRFGDDDTNEMAAKKNFRAMKFFRALYSKITNTLFKRNMSKIYTTLDSHTGDFFCVPFGGRANGRVSTPRPTPSPTTAAPAPSMQTAPTAARASRLFAHVRRDVQLAELGIRRRLRRRWPRLGFRPARADSMWDRTIVSCAYITH